MKTSGITISVGILLILSGCSAFSNYTKETEKARLDVQHGKYVQALSEFPESDDSGDDEILNRMERGTLLQASGDFQKSSAEFESAAKLIEKNENKAVISASKTASQTASLLVNEKVIPYEGQDFEKVMVHSLDALNYLLLGNLEDARVEIRNSYRIQQALYDKHYKELDKAKKDSQGTNWEKSFSSSGDPNYNNMKSKASSVASIYQNAFAYYISSVVYELNNEPDEAYIDLKKAIVAAPDSRAIQNDLQRLSRNLGFTDELQNWQGRYGKADIAPKDYIDIFLVFELGVAPHREEFKLVLPIPSVGLVSVAFPVYVYTPSIVKTGYLSGDSRSTESSIVSDTDAIASRNLLDDYPILVAKQIVRATLKGAATREAGKQGGDWAQLAAGIVFAISEQADLRTWSMLPKQFQVARLFVPKGTTEVTVSAVPNVPGIMSRTVEIPEKASHMIIMARASEKDIVLYTKSF